MHLSTSKSRLNQKRSDLLFNLEKIRTKMNVQISLFASWLELTEKEYNKIQKQNLKLGVDSLFNLSERLEVNLEDLLKGDIDFKVLDARMRGHLDYIAERYTEAAFSKRRTLKNYLDYFEIHFGYEVRERILRHFQISEVALEDPDKTINLLFFMDLLKFLRKLNFSEEHFIGIGNYFAITHQNSPIGDQLRKIKKTSDVFEMFFLDLVQIQEKNCLYSIQSLTKTECIVDSIPIREVANSLGIKNLGSKDVCHYRKGALMSLPMIAHLPKASVQETSCIHLGDSSCRFKIGYEGNHEVQSSRGLYLITNTSS